jgi:hypothetical protein
MQELNIHAALLMLFATAAVGTSIARDRAYGGPIDVRRSLLYIPSGEVVQRVALSYDALAADVYWVRAIQHYGRTKLSKDPHKRYDLLHPLLDITTTLDPQFKMAYRFGAIFLAEPFPNGPGRADLAMALLRKGVAHNPTRWEFLQDIGFVHYWWLGDYGTAARWFQRAGTVPGAPAWLAPLAAATLERGGDRQTARFLWQQLRDAADSEWLRREAERRLRQLDASDGGGAPPLIDDRSGGGGAPPVINERR